MNLFLNKLYSIEEKTNDKVKVKLNQNHEIFSGHFPGNPILPGVCSLQIAKELFLQSQIIAIGSIRYYSPINPNIIQSIVLSYVKEKQQVSIFSDDGRLLVEIKNIHLNNSK
jgi:3-hydroxyacyl-[acyl-carrier-protein] dehydratase